MRIVYVISENLNRTGGGIVHFLAVARGLKELGHDVMVVGPQYATKIKRRPDIKGAYIPVPGHNPLSYLLFQFIVAVLFPFIVLIHRPEVLLLRGGGLGINWLTFLVARLFSVRTVVEINGVVWEELASRGFSRWAVGFSKLSSILQCRTANNIISVTQAIGDSMVEASGVSQEKVFPIPNGADPGDFDRSNRDKIRQAMGIAPEHFVVGFVGQFTPWHGTMEVVSSARNIAPEFLNHIRYVLVGDGTGRGQAEQLIKEANLGEIVQLPGRATREQIKEFMAAFDVGICVKTSSKGLEGSPLKFFEYLAASLPVIVSGYAQLKHLVEDDHMGIVIPAVSPESIAAAITEAYRRREEFKKIGEHNRKLSIEKYSWLETSRRVARVLAVACSSSD